MGGKLFLVVFFIIILYYCIKDSSNKRKFNKKYNKYQFNKYTEITVLLTNTVSYYTSEKLLICLTNLKTL